MLAPGSVREGGTYLSKDMSPDSEKPTLFPICPAAIPRRNECSLPLDNTLEAPLRLQPEMQSTSEALFQKSTRSIAPALRGVPGAGAAVLLDKNCRPITKREKSTQVPKGGSVFSVLKFIFEFFPQKHKFKFL